MFGWRKIVAQSAHHDLKLGKQRCNGKWKTYFAVHSRASNVPWHYKRAGSVKLQLYTAQW